MVAAAELARRAAAERARRQQVDETARLAALRAGVTAPDGDPAAARPGGQVSMSQAAPVGDLAGRGILYAPRPVYPRQAEQDYLVGVIRVRVQVAASGQVIDAEVIESSGIVSLDAAAKRAARGYKFTPRPEAEGTVESGVIPFNFNID